MTTSFVFAPQLTVLTFISTLSMSVLFIPVFPQHFGNLAALYSLFLGTCEMVGDSGGGTCRFAEHTGTSATAARSQAGIPSLEGLSLTATSREEGEASGLGIGAKPRWAGGDLAAPQGMGAPSLHWL